MGKSNLEEIPADVVVEMTAELTRAFKICDCDPTCHCCGKAIEPGTKFKLAYIRSLDDFSVTYQHGFTSNEDEMLCRDCTAADLITYKKKLWKEDEAAYDARHRGYTRKHNA